MPLRNVFADITRRTGSWKNQKNRRVALGAGRVRHDGVRRSSARLLGLRLPINLSPTKSTERTIHVFASNDVLLKSLDTTTNRTGKRGHIVGPFIPLQLKYGLGAELIG